MTEIPVAAGPPCDFTPEYAAIMSVMNLADYSQVKVCAQCAPEYLSGIVAVLTGQGGDGDTAGEDECPLCGSMVPMAEIAAHVQLHEAGQIGVITVTPDPEVRAAVIEAAGLPDLAPPAKPDPLTANVRKSTHGHRSPKPAAGKPDPAGGDPE